MLCCSSVCVRVCCSTSGKSTFSATWNKVDDMKFSFRRHEKYFWRHEKVLATWNAFCRHEIIFALTWVNFWRHEILSATWNEFLGDMNQYWVTWNYFGDMKCISATWNDFGFDMCSFLATWDFIGVMKRFYRRHESIFGHMKLFQRHEASFFGHETFFPVMHQLSASVWSTPPIRSCCQLSTCHEIATQHTTRRFTSVY